jgi:predicted ATPase with chaperone activity
LKHQHFLSKNFAILNPANHLKEIRQRIEAAREIQRKRFENQPYACNALLSGKALREYCALERAQGDFIATGDGEIIAVSQSLIASSFKGVPNHRRFSECRANFYGTFT